MFPTQNEVMEISMIHPGWILLITKPVVIAAIAPDIPVGTIMAAVSKMLCPRRSSRNCLSLLLAGLA